jgi:glycosyltransferase involved in cell wall biosynthesis
VITLAGAIGARTERFSTDPLPSATQAILREADLVWLCRQGPFMHRRLPADLAAPLVVDVDDLEERVIAPGSGVDAVRVWLARRKIVLARARLLNVANAAVVCSDVDAARLAAACPVRVLPNTYPTPAGLDAVPVPAPGAPVVTMIGRMGYRPNHDGARWLIERVWPLVHRLRPDATLVVAGPLSETLPCPYDESGISLLGEVDQVGEVLQAASVVVAPIRSGSGTRVKILEAFAFGKPVVSTTVGAEGIDVIDGQSILLADDPAGFADAILRLFDDPSLARSIADGGSLLFADRYSFTRFRAQVLDIATEAISSAAAGGHAG